MKCSYCQQTELTLEEAKSSKKCCLFCAMDSVINMSRAMGQQLPPPKPSDFGRSKEEYDEYMKTKAGNPADIRNASKSIQEVLDAKNVSKAPTKNTPHRPGQATDFAEDHIGDLLRSYDPDDPPVEFYEGVSDDFYFRASVPGPLNAKMEAIIAKIIKKTFTDIVYLKTQGSFLEGFFRDPDEPTPPQGAFPH
jgi:hypothetical protein